MAKTPTVLNLYLSEAQIAVHELATKIAKMEFAFDNGMPEKAYQLALECVLLTERLAIKIRKIPVHTGRPNALEDVDTQLAEAVPVEMGFTKQGWFVLRIPALLPKKEAGNNEYLRGIIYPALREYFKDKHPQKFDDCIIIYRHVYDKDTPLRQYRDHDNIEINFITDAIAMKVMVDDAPHRCQHHYYSEAGTEEMTEIFVVPVKDYRAWLDAAEAFPEGGIPIEN